MQHFPPPITSNTVIPANLPNSMPIRVNTENIMILIKQRNVISAITLKIKTDYFSTITEKNSSPKPIFKILIYHQIFLAPLNHC